jgi:hypothetical protein
MAQPITGRLPDGTHGAIAVDANGALLIANLNFNVFKSVAGQVITSETTVWTPTSGKKFKLMGYVITQGVATGNITLKDNTAGTTILTIPATPVGQPLAVSLGAGITSATANNVLTATGVSTETISGYFYGVEV